jgi:hypothetical protein
MLMVIQISGSKSVKDDEAMDAKCSFFGLLVIRLPNCPLRPLIEDDNKIKA